MTGITDSIYSSLDELALDRAHSRTRRIEAGMISVLVHAAFLTLGLLMIRQVETPLINKDALVFLSNPIMLPFEENGQGSGGGGGGGKDEPSPATAGRIPETMRRQLMTPDPENPAPLLSIENSLAYVSGIQMPIDILQDESLPIGDISGPTNGLASSGPGSEGGVGTGYGPGVGPGNGVGVGPGSKEGWGGGPGGVPGRWDQPLVVGNGVKAPVLLLQPLPEYTDQARRARIEGIILIQAVVRKNGTVDSFRVLRGLGYGLDESAISTIARKWRFRPGTLNGMPVDVIANIEVSFRLF